MSLTSLWEPLWVSWITVQGSKPLLIFSIILMLLFQKRILTHIPLTVLVLILITLLFSFDTHPCFQLSWKHDQSSWWKNKEWICFKVIKIHITITHCFLWRLFLSIPAIHLTTIEVVSTMAVVLVAEDVVITVEVVAETILPCRFRLDGGMDGTLWTRLLSLQTQHLDCFQAQSMLDPSPAHSRSSPPVGLLGPYNNNQPVNHQANNLSNIFLGLFNNQVNTLHPDQPNKSSMLIPRFFLLGNGFNNNLPPLTRPPNTRDV